MSFQEWLIAHRSEVMARYQDYLRGLDQGPIEPVCFVEYAADLHRYRVI